MKPSWRYAAILLLLIPVVVATRAFTQTGGGFVETAGGSVRAPWTRAELDAFLPPRGRFTFPAPYGTQGVRLTNAADCAGADCVQPLAASGRNINDHRRSDTMLVLVGLRGTGPAIFSYSKSTGRVARLGPLFDASDPLAQNSGEGWYFSARRPRSLYVVGTNSARLQRYDVAARTLETVFDAATQFGADKYISEPHSSDDDRVHSAVLRDASTRAKLGCLVYGEEARQFSFHAALPDFAECTVDRSGRWLLVTEDADGRPGRESVVVDLESGAEQADGDRDVARAIRGRGVPGVAPSQQYACAASAPARAGQASEIRCSRLDGSSESLVVTQSMTGLGVRAGQRADEPPAGNLDVTGGWFVWVGRAQSGRADAFLVRVPGELLVSPAAPPRVAPAPYAADPRPRPGRKPKPPADVMPPSVAITAPTTGATATGMLSVTASASDNSGVAGVQFKLDGTDLGVEDTAAPYSVPWNSSAAANGNHALTAVARDKAGNKATAAVVAVTSSNSALGIAALHPGDVGIENDPNVVFVERFDEATLGDVFARWTDILNGSGMSFSSDVPAGSPGTRSLNIPWVGGGVNNGGHLYKRLSPGLNDTLYVRYYVKYPASGQFHHTGIWTGGYNPPLDWPNPQAGLLPAGNDRFSAAAEQNAATGRFDHYDYWMNMRRSADGNFWGNLLLNDPAVWARSGQWTCIEQMVKLNNPVTAFNGEHAIWLDGVKVSHLGPGFPNGTWNGGIFTQSAAGTPFEGFQWRSDANLNLNYIWLQNYSPDDPAGFSASMYFAHVVVAKSYVGCLAAGGADTAPPTISLTAPAAGATVSGTVTVSASASDNVAVAGVQFKLDGANLGAEDTASPYSVSWNTTAANGSHTLTAVARDAAGNLATAAGVTVTVANDVTPPSVSITAPAGGATVSATVTVTANASDNVGVAGVQFKLDGANLGAEDTASPYSVSWNTTTAANGGHTLTAVARDAAGNTTTAAAVAVTVSNDATPPSVSITAPAGGATVSATVTVTANASDNVGVAGVQFKLDGANLGAEDTASPYSVSWSTTTATNGSHTLTAVARDAAGNQTTSAGVTVTVSNAGSGSGIAALYPGDVGIEANANVVFVERFDEATFTDLFSRWNDILNGSAMAWSSDVPPGSPGTHSLNIPWVGGGVNNGGHLYKVLSPAVSDTLYVRYYIKYPTSGKYHHSGIWMGGYNPPLNYPNPQAGLKPAGNDRFSGSAEPSNATLLFDHYDYWVDMHKSADGNYWGNLLLNNPNLRVNPGQWMCVEQMIKLNNPVTDSNGEHQIWVDGVSVSHVGPGFPNGSWSGGIFTQNPAGTPFPGMRWRSDAALNLNYIWLQNFSPDDPAGFQADMKFDHMVVAKSYIGCLAPSGSPDTTPPVVAITAPTAGATVSGTLTVAATATDNIGVASVQFKLDGNNLGALDTLAPYSISWDSTLTGNGSHTLTAVARDAAGNQTTSAAVTVTVSNASGGGGWPNEPAGLVALTDQPWNAITGGGWNRRSGGTDQIVTDATAPLSPTNVLRYTYPIGLVDGVAPATQYYPLNTKEVFIGMWWKPSNPWQGDISNVNKIQFLQVQNSSVYMTMYGPKNGPYELRSNAQWPEMGSAWLTPNVSGGVVSLGQWHRLEWYLKYESTYGARDGIIRWWMDGVLVGNYTNVRFPNDGGFVEYQISPTWGGNTGDVKTQTDYYSFDHSYLSKR